jgi:AcrR family transcriptional regulator
MQVQKDDIKNRILDAAVEEFLVDGYKQASMRNIAQSAGITVGNIYSYFSGKADLFDNILEETVLQLRQLIDIDVSNENRTSYTVVAFITNRIMEVYRQNRSQFLILMNGAEGSRYENIRSELIELIKLRLAMEFAPAVPQMKEDILLADSLAIAIFEGICNLFNKYGGDEQRLSELLNKFLFLILGNNYTRL